MTIEYQNVSTVNFPPLIIGPGMLPGLCNRTILYFSYSGSPCSTMLSWNSFSRAFWSQNFHLYLLLHFLNLSQHLCPGHLGSEWGASQDQEWQGVRPGRQKHNKHQPIIILTWWGQTPAWWGSPCYHWDSSQDIGGFGHTGTVCQAEQILVKNFS